MNALLIDDAVIVGEDFPLLPAGYKSAGKFAMKNGTYR